MDAHELKRILALLGLLVLGGCGGGAGGNGDGGSVVINVTGAKSFDARAEHGRIERYEVRISGEGIENVIVADFAADATEGVVEGVPIGEGRRVDVRAINPNGSIIRAGEALGVKVDGGLNAVDVAMEAVPIFTNIASGNAVDNTRLIFKVFSDPAHPVIVEEVGAGGPLPMLDASRGVPEFQVDASTGMGRLAPAVMEPGKRTFAVTDLVTGRQSLALVRVLEGRGRRAAPVVSAASTSTWISACSAPACAP
jgi:hypothetical protein